MCPQTTKYKGVNVDFHMYNHWLVNQQRKNRKKVFFVLYQCNVRSICTLTLLDRYCLHIQPIFGLLKIFSTILFHHEICWRL